MLVRGRDAGLPHYRFMRLMPVRVLRPAHAQPVGAGNRPARDVGGLRDGV
jgi:hypothetical protein